LEFLIITATRTSETLGALWDEIDLDAATWTIPPGRMKTNDAFSVPLSDRAIDILRAQAVERGKNPHVFPGRPTKPLSNMALTMLLRRMGVDVTVHGYRTSFRTWCSDVAHAEFEIAEMCLSHRIGSAVSRAYNRTTMLERRRPLMSAWADYVTGKTSDNVIPLATKRG
jgi:integrase